jgi:hypothetical protein
MSAYSRETTAISELTGEELRGNPTAERRRILTCDALRVAYQQSRGSLGPEGASP